VHAVGYLIYKSKISKLHVQGLCDKTEIGLHMFKSTQYWIYHNDSTPCPRKNYNTVYVAITLANNVGF